jgi:hypothetical protein
MTASKEGAIAYFFMFVQYTQWQYRVISTHAQNKQLKETNLIVIFNERRGFYNEFKAILSANLHVSLHYS